MKDKAGLINGVRLLAVGMCLALIIVGKGWSV
jgi:hypothetical protein